jgi:hypothetical protein
VVVVLLLAKSGMVAMVPAVFAAVAAVAIAVMAGVSKAVVLLVLLVDGWIDDVCDKQTQTQIRRPKIKTTDRSPRSIGTRAIDRLWCVCVWFFVSCTSFP